MKQQENAVSDSGLLSKSSRDSIAPEIETFAYGFVRSTCYFDFVRTHDDFHCSYASSRVDVSHR